MQQAVFYSLSSDEQVVLAALTAILLANGLNANQLNILGNFLASVGQNMLVIQAVVSAAPSSPDTTACSCDELKDLVSALQKQVEQLQQKIAALEQN